MTSYATVKDALSSTPVDLEELHAATGISRRTIRYALRQLVEDGEARRAYSLKDTRRALYWRPGGDLDAN